MAIKTKCLLCKRRTSVKMGAIISRNHSIGDGLVCPKCTRSKLEGQPFFIRDCPKVIIEGAKKRATEQGLTFRAVVIRLVELYGMRTIDE